MTDLLYSFGTSHPGAIVLHNFPRCLQHFHRAGRRASSTWRRSTSCAAGSGACPATTNSGGYFHLHGRADSRTSADDPAVVEDCGRIYRDPEDVDPMIGLYAEATPKGFGFSDTAFRVFILMASRRLKSDRFFTYDFRPEVYTQRASTGSTTTRCGRAAAALPELEPALEGVANPFAPWKRTGRRPIAMTESHQASTASVTGRAATSTPSSSTTAASSRSSTRCSRPTAGWCSTRSGSSGSARRT